MEQSDGAVKCKTILRFTADTKFGIMNDDNEPTRIVCEGFDILIGVRIDIVEKQVEMNNRDVPSMVKKFEVSKSNYTSDKQDINDAKGDDHSHLKRFGIQAYCNTQGKKYEEKTEGNKTEAKKRSIDQVKKKEDKSEGARCLSATNEPGWYTAKSFKKSKYNDWLDQMYIVFFQCTSSPFNVFII